MASFSSNQTLLTFLLCVRQTWIWLNWFWKFLCERIVVLICMVLQFVWRKDFLYMGLVFRKLCRFLLMFHSVPYFCFLYRSLSSSLCTVFYSIPSNIDEVLLINPSANVFVFADFNVYHKDWLTYSGGTDRPVNCYNFFYLKWPYSDG